MPTTVPATGPVFRKLNLEKLKSEISSQFDRVLQVELVRPEPETLQDQAEDLFKEALASLRRR